MGPNDVELWQSACSGHVEAFGDVFDRHADAICGFCFRRTADRAAAEDLTSIVFLEAWRRRQSVRFYGTSALPWLYGVATNVVRNHQRSLRRHAAALARLPRPEPEPDFAGDVDERVDIEAAMKQIADLVAELPTPEQDVFVLCVWQDLPYAAAAQALELAEATVRSRLFRARGRIREQLTSVASEVNSSPEEAPYR